MPFTGQSPVIRLKAGEAFFSPAPHRIATLLGSCVAACLWDPQHRMGGMTHSLIPTGRDGSIGNPLLATDQAIVSLMDRMVAAGSRMSRLQAKLFGGFTPLTPTGGESIGAGNIRAALRLLQRAGIDIVAQEILGEGGLMIYMETESGQVLARRFGRLGR